MGTIKGVGRIYQQTFIDTYSKVAFAKLYDRKNALVAADTLNDRVLPFFEANNVQLLRVLTDRGTEYCGSREHHEYPLYLALEDIDHSRTKARHPRSTAFANASTRPCRTSFAQPRSARRSTPRWSNYRPTSTDGLKNTIASVRIRVNTALAKRRCRPSWPRAKSPGIRS